MLIDRLLAVPLPLRKGIVAALIRARALSPEDMAAFARSQTSFYASFYEGFDTDDFTSLPILSKTLVRDVPPYDLLATSHRDRVVYYAETTGSTGSPTPAFYTRGEFRSARVLGLLSAHFQELRGLLTTHRACVNGMAYGLTIAGMSFGDLLEFAGGLTANVGSRSTLATPTRIARVIARLAPVAVAATPIDFLSWMRILEEDHPERVDRVHASLKMLLSSAELCARSRVARIEEHFGLRHVDVYACVEGFFTLACTCGEKHVLPAYHTELFDADLKPIGPFGTGRLAFTNLVKRSTPMLRYLLDDWVTIRRSSCPLGFGTSVVPHGRYELNVSLGDEQVNVEQIEDALFSHGLFGDYRAVVFDDHMELQVERYAPRHDSEARISEHFRARFGLPAQVTFVPFGTITPYREPRQSKPILKLEDRRSGSSQETPEFL